MKTKIFRKFFITTSAISLLSILVLIILLSIFFRGYMEREKKSLLIKNCRTVSSMAARWVSYPETEEMLSVSMGLTGNASDSVFFISDTNGRIAVCGCREWNEKGSCEHSSERIRESVLSTAMSGTYYELGTFGGALDSVHYIVGVPLMNAAGDCIGVVFGISPASTIHDAMTQMYRIYLLSLIIPIVMLFIAISLITYKLTRPLGLMSSAAQSIAVGDFSKRIPVNGSDEIAELSAAFNHMTDSLARSEKMRRNFIANVSHELRTPMTTIGGFVDGILDGTIEKDRQSEYLRTISEEVKRLTRLVQSMLSLAKLESGEMEVAKRRFDISEVLFKVVISQERRIESRRINIEGLEDIGHVFVEADEDLIHQVIYNLVDNAVKFTGEGGYIRFGITGEEQGKCIFRIRNSGQGIPSDDLPYVFERFYKVDKSRSANRESTGLGLYIVRTIISIHGGTVTVRSKYGEYTEFEFCLGRV